ARRLPPAPPRPTGPIFITIVATWSVWSMMALGAGSILGPIWPLDSRPEADLDRQIGIKLDPSDPRPLYQQIVDQVLTRTQRGALPVGFRLPPSRVLAAELGVHRNTVVRAFEELQSMGLISATVGRGSFVSRSSEPAVAPVAPISG